MAELLQYSFEVIGAANVERALASMERRMAQHNAFSNRMFAGRPGGASAGRGGRLAAGGGGMAGAEVVRESAAMLKKVERERAASEKRIAREAVAADKRAWNEKLSEAKRYSRIRAQAEISAQREVANASKEFRRRTVGDAYGRVGGAVRAVGTAGLAMAGVAGAGLAASSISQALTLDEKSRRLAISARGAGESDQYSAADLQKRATATSIATGVKPEDAIDAAQAFVGKTGDIKTAVENMRVFATVAQATGSSLQDVSSTAADLAQKFDIKSTEEMGNALAVLAFQGKKGAFELRDMANTFPEIAAAAQRAGLKGVGGMKVLGGLAQIARQSTGNGAEASTALQMALTQLTAKSGELHSGAALGGKTVDVFEGGDATKNARDLPTVLAEVISKSHGNVEQLGKVFDVRGIRAVSPMISAYRETAQATKGTAAQKEAAGKDAILKLISDASNASGDFTDVEKDAADAMKAVNVQLEVLATEFRSAVASQLFPIFARLAPRVIELLPAVSRITQELVNMAEVAASNPFSTLGATVGALIGQEIAKAMIADVIQKGLTSSLGTGGLVVGSVIATVAMAKLYVEQMFQQARTDVEKAASAGDEIRTKAREELAASGTISPDTKSKLQALHATEQDFTARGRDALKNYDTFDFLGRAYNSVTGGKRNLQEFATLSETAGNAKYQAGASDTERLLMISDILEKGGKNAAEAMKSGAEMLKAGAEEASKKLGGVSALNRGNAPSPVKG